MANRRTPPSSVLPSAFFDEASMFLDIDGNKVFSLSFGKGPRTLLAHSGWIGNFEDWIATLAPLSETWRTVVYDHRGAGETQVPVELITPEALVEDVFRVMDAANIDRCVLAGFSRGTVTVMRAALLHPERFEGLVLMNGTGDVQIPDTPVAPRAPPSAWPGETFTDHLKWFADRCTPEPDTDHIKRWAVNVLSRSSAEVAERIFTMQPREPIDWPHRLPELKLPTLLIHGDKDPLCRTAIMEYLHSLLPNSKLVVMKDTGHLPAMVRPHDVAREVNEFFGSVLG